MDRKSESLILNETVGESRLRSSTEREQTRTDVRLMLGAQQTAADDRCDSPCVRFAILSARSRGPSSSDCHATYVCYTWSPRNEPSAHALALRAGRTCDDGRLAFVTRLIPRGDDTRMRALRSLMVIQFAAHPPIRLILRLLAGR